jgi:putative heme-binding domain-containing protein
MRNSSRRYVGLLIVSLAAIPSLAESCAFAAEKWADPRLPVTNGLVVWLDAARLSKARAALGLPLLRDGDTLDQWPDASGHKRRLAQADPRVRPAYRPTGDFHAIRFNGQDAHFRLSNLGQSFREMTVFVVAAPFSNPDWFTAFLAMSAAGKNDYETGLNIDQGTGPPQRFQVLNIEGAGCQGAKNLLREPLDFGAVARLCVTSAPGKDGVALWLNGQRQGARDRTATSLIRMDELIVGARYYTNGGPPQVRGVFDGDLAEILIYDRVLGDADRTAVEKYLTDKYGRVGKLPPPGPLGGKPLVRVADPPPVQVLVPGFTVRQLPVDLTNINNVLYRSDGKLVALGYDGNIYLLSDSDGDGLEDKIELFWINDGRLRAPIGMALTPPGYPHGNGVFVAAKGVCLLLLDSSGKGRADKEIVVAEGWTELPHGVDALGVTVDPKDGSVYFGLGAQDYEDAYGAVKKGAKPYDRKSERGAILRVAPDFKSREIIATGIRFSVGLRFNRYGDLFCTDQEGATWLPNGNPFDELLHIQKGRHYGFPPRHPTHLSDVIDEPSVFDYAPQHQSTCGLNFNEPVNGGPIVGPAWWQSDAFVAGYSRGKLYRTKLIKSPAGYVAQNQILACLNMLTCDACISPKGELVVAVHSGGPDWGSGPTGKGRLYKIAYTGKDQPQPALVWPQSPHEIRIAFDRPLDPEKLAGLNSGTTIELGRYVAAGDRFESLWPGYKVVQNQMRTPRFGLPVHGVQVTPDSRTLIVSTAAHPETATYAVTLPGLGRPTKPDIQRGELPQVPDTDLAYNLSGVEAVWRPKGTGQTWFGWLPHVDLAVARVLTQPSAGHAEFWNRTREQGDLTLRTTLNLQDMLRPAVQPGSKIDYEWPAERVTLEFRSTSPFQLKTGGANSASSHAGEFVISETFAATDRAPIEIVIPTGAGVPDLRVAWHTNEDARPRALPLHRMTVPWAPLARSEVPQVVAADAPELKGGNWARGRQVFLSEQALCSKCHAIHGEGAAIGPDLSNLPHRDYASVLRDIAEPSFAINPDFITQRIVLKNGRVLIGSVRTEGDRLLIGDEKGAVTQIRRAEIEEAAPTGKSIMPDGVPKLLGPDKLRDLLTFLLTEPPRMPDYGRSPPPEPRRRHDVEAILAGAPPDSPAAQPLKIVLVAGRKDHGPGEHDYPAWQRSWSRLLSLAENVTVTTADDWPAERDMKVADVVVFYQQGKWTAERARHIDAFLERGGGLVYIHFAVDGGADAPGFAQRIGLAWQGGQSKFRHGPLDLGFATGMRHPIGRNFGAVHFHDESYWQLVGDPKRINLLATGPEDGQSQPLFWTLEPAKGRVFVSIPGHFAWTFDDPLFRILLLRGIAWTAREPVDRLNDLVWPGARVRD